MQQSSRLLYTSVRFGDVPPDKLPDVLYRMREATAGGAQNVYAAVQLQPGRDWSSFVSQLQVGQLDCAGSKMSLSWVRADSGFSCRPQDLSSRRFLDVTLVLVKCCTRWRLNVFAYAPFIETFFGLREVAEALQLWVSVRCRLQLAPINALRHCAVRREDAHGNLVVGHGTASLVAAAVDQANTISLSRLRLLIGTLSGYTSTPPLPAARTLPHIYI